MTKFLASAALALSLFAVPTSANTRVMPKTHPTITEIERTIGFVPSFIRAIPDALLPGWWDQVKALELNPKTALDGKTKELIGLAVAAQIPCDYCVYIHTKIAKANGATEQQIQEAIGMAALTRSTSTLLQGSQVDLATYKKDVDRAFTPAKK